MEEIYRTKYPLKQVFISILVILAILLYIFWGLLHFVFILLIGIVGIFLISNILIPIFVLQEKALIRLYTLRPFSSKYIYQIEDIKKIEIKQERQGYQAFPSMKIFFLEKGRERKHHFHFIKDTQEDFDSFVQKMKENGVDVKLLSGN
ncbi:hypothetical protein [Spongiimicrobium sp. 3-5]|uniref:hypothetical protein n=1 Tax=Spongiimicrobium sp. 3-5 TaxID=3332596 RepID=UPI00397F91A1